MRLLVLIVAPLAVGLGVIAPTLVKTFFDERWSRVADMLIVLSVLSVVRPIGWIGSSYLQVRNKPREIMFLEITKTLGLLALMVIFTKLHRVVDLMGLPEAWAFTANSYGRPEIASPAGCPLSFNLSNTDGLIVCLVAREREIGVDVEDIERRGETVALADRFFSAAEVAALHASPEASRRERFFDYWTLKEAYIKARGMGLAIPLDHFSFLIEMGKPIRIEFDPRLPDDAASWQFAQLRVAPRHLISAAVRRREEPDARFVVRRTIPLLPASEGIEETMT